MTAKVPGASPTAMDVDGYELHVGPARLIRGCVDGFPLVIPYARRCWRRGRPPEAVAGSGSRRVKEDVGGQRRWLVPRRPQPRRAAGPVAGAGPACRRDRGDRWRVADQLAAERGLALVGVQPLRACRAREGADLTRDKSGPEDAVLIARLAGELRCYEPERADAVRARLWHLGARRGQLTTDASGPCPPRWPARPGSPRTGPAPRHARSWHWASGGIPAPSWPGPKPGWARS